MINTQYINLNMVPSGVMPMLYCSQYDIGRLLGMVVYNGGEAVDLDGYTCTIETTRTDGTAITAAVTTDGNIGVFETTAVMTNHADTYKAKFVIVDGNGKRVASLAFVLCVTAATMDENSEEIEEDASLYQQYTGTVQALIAEIRKDMRKYEVWLNVAGFCDGTLTSSNIAAALIAALLAGRKIYIPAGTYTFNVEITSDCDILIDEDATLSTSNSSPCIKATGCSVTIHGGTFCAGANDSGRDFVYGTTEESHGIIQLESCHDCRITQINSTHSKYGAVIQIKNCINTEISGCTFDNILHSAVHILDHCVDTIVKNCKFTNIRYAGTKYYCYAVYTGSEVLSNTFTPPDGLIYENNYVYDSEDCALDTHGAKNVIFRNNTILETVCAITAYNDNRRVTRPTGWNMENIIIENNYCKSSKSNNPNATLKHAFVFLGASNQYAADDPGYGSNPGSYKAYRHCILRNNTIISDSANIISVVYLNSVAVDMLMENNYIDATEATHAVYGWHQIGIRIKNCQFPSNNSVFLGANSCGEVVDSLIKLPCLTSTVLQHFKGAYTGLPGRYLPTVIDYGEVSPVYYDTELYTVALAQDYGMRVTSKYQGSLIDPVTVTVTDSIAYADGIGKILIPKLAVILTDMVTNETVYAHVTELIDYDHVRIRLNTMVPVDEGTYSLSVRRVETIYNPRLTLLPYKAYNSHAGSIYINVRDAASQDGNVIGKIANNSTVLKDKQPAGTYSYVTFVDKDTGKLMSGYTPSTYLTPI